MDFPWRFIAFILLTIAMFYSFDSKGADFRLFNHQSKQYKAWTLATNRMYIAKSAEHVGIPKDILLAVCFQESKHEAIGAIPDGDTMSYGICQMKLGTAIWMRNEFKIAHVPTPKNLTNVKTNSFYAALFLLYQYKRYGDWISAIEAYNKGSKVSGPKSKYVKSVLLAMKGF